MGRKSVLVTQALLLPIDSVVQFAEQQNLAPVPHPSPDFHLLLFWPSLWTTWLTAYTHLGLESRFTVEKNSLYDIIVKAWSSFLIHEKGAANG